MTTNGERPVRGRGASIRDVAAMAGVSHQTVSRVLNSPDVVAPHTRARVERAIRTLRFQPNAAARALRSNRTATVGVLVQSSSLFVSSDGLSVLERHLRDAGLRMLITGLVGDDRAAVDAALAPLLEFGVDALVIAANQRAAADVARELARTGTVVAMQPGITMEDGLSSASVDFDAAIRISVAHLVEQGARVLDFVPGPEHLTTMTARTVAWVRELGTRRLELRPLVPTPMTVDGGRAAARRLLEQGLPEAVLCANDLMAMGMLNELARHGVDVPGEVLVMGMDNFFGTDVLTPSLTSVEQPWHRLGAETARLVVEALAGAPHVSVRLEPTLVVRESTTHATGRKAQA